MGGVLTGRIWSLLLSCMDEKKFKKEKQNWRMFLQTRIEKKLAQVSFF